MKLPSLCTGKGDLSLVLDRLPPTGLPTNLTLLERDSDDPRSVNTVSVHGR